MKGPGILRVNDKGRTKMQKMHVCIFLIFWGLIWSNSSVAAADVALERATVKAETSAVYSEMSAKSDVVKTLKKGNVVQIEMEMLGSEGVWCRIIEKGQPESLGFVLCESLDRPEQKLELVGSSIIETEVPSEQAPHPEKKPTTPDELQFTRYMPGKYMPFLWARGLGFSPDQLNQLVAFLEKSGVFECYRMSVELMMGAGLPIPVLDPDVHIGTMACSREYLIDTSLCRKRIKKFWRKFPDIMTPQQREKFQKAEKLVPDCP